MSQSNGLRTTPLTSLHIELGARMVPFAGYTMPVQFSEGIIAEHLHTRTHAGLFDVSHMGQIQVAGPEAVRELEALMPVDLEGLARGAFSSAPATSSLPGHGLGRIMLGMVGCRSPHPPRVPCNVAPR